MVGRSDIAPGFQCYFNIAVKLNFVCSVLSILLKHQKGYLSFSFLELLL